MPSQTHQGVAVRRLPPDDAPPPQTIRAKNRRQHRKGGRSCDNLASVANRRAGGRAL